MISSWVWECALLLSLGQVLLFATVSICIRFYFQQKEDFLKRLSRGNIIDDDEVEPHVYGD